MAYISCGCGPRPSVRSITTSVVEARRFAVLGAGFAGISVAWHLLQHADLSSPISVDLFDEVGIGAGASGASGGLLHPFSPKGKLLWKGDVGWVAAMELLDVAERTIYQASRGEIEQPTCQEVPIGPIAWRRGIIRPILAENHARRVRKNLDKCSAAISCISGATAKSYILGLSLRDEDLVLHMPNAINIHPQNYLKALWVSCKLFAKDAAKNGCIGTKATFKKEFITCLSDIAGKYDGVIVCLGAKSVLLPELAGKLPLSLCQGITAQLCLPSEMEEQYNSGAPNILSNAWLALRGQRTVILGATKDWTSDCSVSLSNETTAYAFEELIGKAATFYPPIKSWSVSGFSAGIRAMPPRNEMGALPLTGCIDEILDPSIQKKGVAQFWFFGGLGSRGLVYHAWLGKQVAKAAILQHEAILPKESLAWKYGGTETGELIPGGPATGGSRERVLESATLFRPPTTWELGRMQNLPVLDLLSGIKPAAFHSGG